MKDIIILLIISLFFNSCKSKKNGDDNHAETKIVTNADTLSSPVPSDRIAHKKLVVGFKELDIFFLIGRKTLR